MTLPSTEEQDPAVIITVDFYTGPTQVFRVNGFHCKNGCLVFEDTEGGDSDAIMIPMSGVSRVEVVWQ
jgi:hypothetical protein